MKIIPQKRCIVNLTQSEKWFNLSWVYLKTKVKIIEHKNGQIKGRGGGRKVLKEYENVPAEKRELYRNQARIRAGQKVYELADENDLRIMWTLTYEREEEKRKIALNDFKTFIKRLNYHLDRKVPYVAVIEVQKEREKKTGKAVLHFHMATDKYIDQKLLAKVWGHGYVKPSKFKDGTTISGNKKAVAMYLSKYLKKDMEDNPDLVGQKMYLNSKGLKRPPRGSGIVDKEQFDRLEADGLVKGYNIKDREDLRGHAIQIDDITQYVTEITV